MDLWLGTVGVVAVAVAGVFLARMFSRLGKAYWACGYFIALIIVAMLLAVRCSIVLSFLPPFSWIATGLARFPASALAITLGMITPLSRLPRRSEKYITGALTAVFVGLFSVGPFIAPALFRGDLSTLQTKVDAEGVCFQSRSYTCGPAAAVTALRKLGFNAQEGEIAILARTSPITGTLPRCLHSALRKRYGKYGLKCRYRYFDSIAQLKSAGITLAIVRDAFMLDHCVAVLEVSDHTVIVADPVLGKQQISHEQFEKMWRFTGIVLTRAAVRSI